MNKFSELFRALGLKNWEKHGKNADAWSGGHSPLSSDGLPAILYSGTPKAGFDAFDLARSGSNTGATDARGFAAWLTSHPQVASQYAETMPRSAITSANFADYLGVNGFQPGVMPLFARLERPLTVDMNGAPYSVRHFSEISKEASLPKYDGMIIKNVDDALHGSLASNVYAVKNPSQVKSVFNRGTFDPTDPNFLRSAAPAGSGILGALGLSSQGSPAAAGGPLSWLLANFTIPRAFADAVGDAAKAVDQQGNIVSGAWKFSGQDDVGNSYYRDAQGNEHKMPPGHTLKSAIDMAGLF